MTKENYQQKVAPYVTPFTSMPFFLVGLLDDPFPLSVQRHAMGLLKALYAYEQGIKLAQDRQVKEA